MRRSLGKRGATTQRTILRAGRFGCQGTWPAPVTEGAAPIRRSTARLFARATSIHRPAAVDVDELPGDEGDLIGGQEDRRPDDIVGCSASLHRLDVEKEV